MNSIHQYSQPVALTQTGRASQRLLPWMLLLCFSLTSAVAQIEWTPEAQVNWEMEFDDLEPTIAVDGDGIVWVAWIRQTEEGSGLWYAHWNGDAWLHEEELCPEATGGAGKGWPELAVGGDGAPHVIWSQYTSGYMQIYYSRWTGEEWAAAEQVTTGNNSRYSPDLAVSGDGTPWVVWNQWDAQTGLFDIYHTTRDQDGWTAPSPVETDSDIVDWDAEIACAGNDDVWVVWHRYAGPGDQEVCYSHWEGDEWSETAYLTSTPDEYEQLPTLSTGPRGRPWAVWQVSRYGEATRNIQSALWDGDGWEPRGYVNEPDAMLHLAPAICIDRASHPWVTWWTSSGDVYLCGWEDQTWGEQRRVTHPDSVADFGPRLVSDPGGIIWVVWEGGRGYDNDIFFGRLDPSDIGDTMPPYPTRLTVSAPYPNPARSDVWMHVRPCSNAETKLLIHDATGRLIKSHLWYREGPDARDTRTVLLHWDGRDSRGHRVSPGTYYCTVVSGKHAQTQRIIMLQ